MADEARAPGSILVDAEDALAALAPAAGPPPLSLAVQQSVDAVVRSCRGVQLTVDSVGGALQVFDAPEAGWGDYGLAGLPAAAAMKVVSSFTSQYLQKSTRMGLDGWIGFVHECSETFDNYIDQMEEAVLHGGLLDESATEASVRSRVDAASSLRRETAAWKAVLNTVEDLGKVVDAVRAATAGTPRVDPEGFDQEPEGVVEASRSTPAELAGTDSAGSDRTTDGGQTEEAGAGLGGWTRRAFGGTRQVSTRAAKRGSDMLGDARQGVSGIGQRIRPSARGMVEWATGPLMDLTGQVAALPANVAELREEVTLLEVLLDLQVASLLAELGELSDADASLVNLRVAASVWLPGLSDALQEADASVAEFRRRIERVEERYSLGRVGERAKTLLLNEYESDMASARARRDELERFAAAWRVHGDVVVSACEKWAADEVDILEARDYAEGRSAPSTDRLVLLQREVSRLQSAREALMAL